MKRKIRIATLLLLIAVVLTGASVLIRTEHACHYQAGWPFPMRNELKSGSQFSTVSQYDDAHTSIFCGNQTYIVSEIMPIGLAITLNVGIWYVALLLIYVFLFLFRDKSKFHKSNQQSSQSPGV